MKDVDFDRNVIIVRDAKGGKDRVVMLPHSIALALQDSVMMCSWPKPRKTGVLN